MKRTLYILGLAILVSACGTDSSQEVDASQASTQEQEQVVVVPNRLATMEIDGMVCKMGCGGAIRKELYSIGGVSEVKFDFEEERLTNVATISFDKNMVTLDEMIEAVSAINDGQFTVGNTDSESLEVTNVPATNSSSGEEDATVEVSTSNIEMPNFLDLLGDLFFS